MSTSKSKPFAKVTDKKVGVATKQVPTPAKKPTPPAKKSAPVKAAGPAKASVKVTPKVESKKPDVKSTTKPVTTKPAPQVKKGGMVVVAKKTTLAKKAVEVKPSPVKALEVAVKKTGADTKGYQVSTHEKQAAFAAKRNMPLTVTIIQKPGKAPTATIGGKPASPNKVATVVLAELKKQVGKPSATPLKGAVAGPIRGLSADKQPGVNVAEPAKKSVKPAVKPTVKTAKVIDPKKPKIVVHGHRLNRAADMHRAVESLNLKDKIDVIEKPLFDPAKTVKKVEAAPAPVPARPAYPSLKLPGMMTTEQAQARSDKLRQNFNFLASTIGAKR